MSPIFFSQIALDTKDVLPSWHLDPLTREWIIIISVSGVVALLAVGWAIFLRKRHRRRHSHHHRHRHSPQPTETPVAPNAAGAAAPPEKRRHRRRSHHRHSRLNPTLAETGGLPPIRPEDPPAPQP